MDFLLRKFFISFGLTPTTCYTLEKNRDETYSIVKIDLARDIRNY